MPAIENNTPFAAKVFGSFDSNAREWLVLVVTATFAAEPGCEPEPAEEPLDIEPVDRHRGDPVTTSVHYPGQLGLRKPLVDVIVTGHAYAPHGRLVETMLVGLRVADLKKVVSVSGDRFWKRGLAGSGPSAPQPFDRMPIIYERAFGGGAVPVEGGKSFYEPRNPVGVGLGASTDPNVETEVPNLEYPSDRMASPADRPAPASFGALAPGWQPRAGFGGTYDDAWLKDQAPLLPHDFDPRFFQVAPPDQQSKTVQPGDLVEVVGMTPEGHWSFRLPRLDVPVSLVYADRIEKGEIAIDTIQLEPDQYRFHVTGRLPLTVVRNRAPLAQIVLGTMRPGWLRARYSGKVYRRSKGATS